MFLFFVVTDSFLAKGQFILHQIAENRKSYDVHVLCYEHIASKLQHSFLPLSNINFHDCMTSDICMYDTIEDIIKKATRKVVILIDSLSIYLLRSCFSKVYKEILDIISSDKGK